MTDLNISSDEYFSACENSTEIKEITSQDSMTTSQSMGNSNAKSEFFPLPLDGSPKMIQEIDLSHYLKSKDWVLSFNDQNGLLALGSEKGIVLVYELSTKPPFLYRSTPIRYFQEHSKAVTGIAWLDNSRFLTTSLDGLVKEWSVYSQYSVSEIPHNAGILCVAKKSPDTFAVGSSDKFIRVYRQRVLKLSVHTPHPVTSLTYKGDTLAAGMHRGIVHIYQPWQGNVLRLHQKLECRNRRGLKSAGRVVNNISFTAHGCILVSTLDDRIRVFKDGLIIAKYKARSFKMPRLGACLSDDEQFILSASKNEKWLVWDFRHCTAKKTCCQRHVFKCKGTAACFVPRVALNAINRSSYHVIASVGKMLQFFCHRDYITL